MKIRIIDLLNKIANGEELPSKIIFDTEEYHKLNSHTYIRETDDGITRDLYDEYNLINCLNDEVEIIEEDKKIEKIKVVGCNVEVNEILFGTDTAVATETCIAKINELIDTVNDMKEGK